MASTTFTPNLNIQTLRIRKFCRGNRFYYQLETLRDAFQKEGTKKISWNLKLKKRKASQEKNYWQ